jgi:hypothetical protein
MSLEQLLATQNELMRVLTKNLVHRGGHQPVIILHRLPGDAPSDICQGG